MNNRTFIRFFSGLNLPVLLCCGALLLSAPSGANAAQNEGIEWAESLEEVNARTKTDDKIIFANFYTTWCGYCKQLDAETLTDPRVVVLSREFVSIRINAERGSGPSLAEQYKVSSYPNLFFLDSAGEVVENIPGFVEGKPFATQMAQTLQARGEDRLKKEAKENPKDGQAAISLSVMYTVLDQLDDAQKYLLRANKVDIASDEGKKNLHRLKIANLLLAEAKFEESQFIDAIPFYQKASEIATDPSEVVLAQLKMGFCHFQSGNNDQARQIADEVLKRTDLTKEEKKMADDLMEMSKK